MKIIKTEGLSTPKKLRQDQAEYWSWLFSKSPTDRQEPVLVCIADSALPIRHRRPTPDIIRVTRSLPSRPGRIWERYVFNSNPPKQIHCCYNL